MPFRKHRSHLSEIFWKDLEDIWSSLGHLVTSPCSRASMLTRAPSLVAAVYEKTRCLDNCIGFWDGTVLCVARLCSHATQNVVYNGHKRQHALTFQALTGPHGRFYYVFGSMEGRRHDWTLYTRSELEEILSSALHVGGRQFCIYGDSRYNRRVYLEIPFKFLSRGNQSRSRTF